MNNILLVGLGGFFGSSLRYIVLSILATSSARSAFPFGILLVNIIGCLFVGIISGLGDRYHILTPQLRLIIIIGFLGGFTTFSALSLEAFSLIQAKQVMLAMLDMFLQLSLGVMAVWLGFTLALINK